MIIKVRTLGILAISLAAGVFLFSQTQESAQLFEKNKDGVLSLFVYGGNKDLIAKGVGFGLAEDVVATSYHLVSQAEEVEGVNIKGKKMKLEGIISVDRTLDVDSRRVQRRPSPRPWRKGRRPHHRHGEEPVGHPGERLENHPQTGKDYRFQGLGQG